jgi:hypothetical protein
MTSDDGRDPSQQAQAQNVIEATLNSTEVDRASEGEVGVNFGGWTQRPRSNSSS